MQLLDFLMEKSKVFLVESLEIEYLYKNPPGPYGKELSTSFGVFKNNFILI